MRVLPSPPSTNIVYFNRGRLSYIRNIDTRRGGGGLDLGGGDYVLS